jgi:hypothetical protein
MRWHASVAPLEQIPEVVTIPQSVDQAKATMLEELDKTAEKAVDMLDGYWNDPDMVEDMYQYFADNAFELFKTYVTAVRASQDKK